LCNISQHIRSYEGHVHTRNYRCKVIGSVTKNYIQMVYKMLAYTKTLDFTNFVQMV